jgi:hypothetical protein
VRATGLESIPTTTAGHDLLAVVQGVTATASMARLDGHHASRLITSRPASVAPDD